MSKHKHDQKEGETGVVPAAPGQAPSGQAAAPESARTEPETQAAQEASEDATERRALEETQKALAALKAELSELNDKYLRKLAEEVNFRKRMMREKEDAQRYGISGLLGDIIPVLDDLDRAIASAETARSFEQLHDGVLLIRRQLSQMLENKYYLKRVQAAGVAFDPNIHEAVAAEPADVEEAVVSEEFLSGYILHDRVLRTAKVRVKVPNPAAAPRRDQDTAQ